MLIQGGAKPIFIIINAALEFVFILILTLKGKLKFEPK